MRLHGPLLSQIAHFALVGGLGTVTNLVCFFFLVDRGGLAPLVGSTLAFSVAVTQNYVLNELWTFNREGTGRIARRRYVTFLLFSTLALGVNLLILQLLLERFWFPLMVIPQAIGILGGMVLNFAASRFITFR